MGTSIQAQGTGGCPGGSATQTAVRAYPHLQAYGSNVTSMRCRGSGGIPVMRDQVHLSWIKGQGVSTFDESV